MNLVTIIPLPEPDSDEVFWQIGFQVDVTEQPNAILQSLHDGTYIVNYSLKEGAPTLGSLTSSRDWKINSAMMSGVSKSFRTVLADTAFIDSVPISTGANASASSAVFTATAAATSTIASPTTDFSPLSPHPPGQVNTLIDPYDGNKPLHMVLLEASPDFIHVLSLKGAFLYVAPAVRHVLGYEPDELVGKSLADLAHKADIVPLMRELKESSSPLGGIGGGGPPISAHPLGSSSVAGKTGSSSALSSAVSPDSASSLAHTHSPYHHATKAVDLLFRMRHKSGAFVWVESRGRLHVEPGKGRKAIILCGRVREMPRLDWARVESAGGVRLPVTSTSAPVSTPAPVAEARGSQQGAAQESEKGGGKGQQDQDIRQRGGKEGEEEEEEEEEQQDAETDREMWGLVSGAGTFLFVGVAVKDVLGWGAGEVIGRAISDFIVPGSTGGVVHALQDVLRGLGQRRHAVIGNGGPHSAAAEDAMVTRSVQCEMNRKDGAKVAVQIVFYHVRPDMMEQVNPSPVVCQIRVCDDDPGGSLSSCQLPSPVSVSASPADTTHSPTQTQRLVHPLNESVFVELDVARGSSWQYELQQLKFQNQRLADQVTALEAAVQSKTRKLQSSSHPNRPFSVGHAASVRETGRAGGNSAVPLAAASMTGKYFAFQETSANQSQPTHTPAPAPVTWTVPPPRRRSDSNQPMMVPSSMTMPMPVPVGRRPSASLKRAWSNGDDGGTGASSASGSTI